MRYNFIAHQNGYKKYNNNKRWEGCRETVTPYTDKWEGKGLSPVSGIFP